MEASDPVRVLFCIGPGTVRRDRVDDQAKKAYGSDPRDARNYQPKNADKYPAVIDLSQPRDQ